MKGRPKGFLKSDLFYRSYRLIWLIIVSVSCNTSIFQHQPIISHVSPSSSHATAFITHRLYMIVSDCGILLLIFSTSQEVHIGGPYPPFGVATLTVLNTAAFLMLI